MAETRRTEIRTAVATSAEMRLPITLPRRAPAPLADSVAAMKKTLTKRG
jgi:hypothetical protein